jgi:hypothetical protein
MTDLWWQAPLWHDCRLDGEADSLCSYPGCFARTDWEIEIAIQDGELAASVGVYYRCKPHADDLMHGARQAFHVPVVFALCSMTCNRVALSYPPDIPDLGALV